MGRRGEPGKAGELGGDPQAGFKGSPRLWIHRSHVLGDTVTVGSLLLTC